MFFVNGVQTHGPEDWRQALAEPERHWKPGYSAWALAHCWEAARGFPVEIRRLLTPLFPDIEMVKGMVEYRTGLTGSRGGSSHNDLFVYAIANGENLCISIEGKVSEKLGARLREWHTGTDNREKRLKDLCNHIGLDRSHIPDTIRYQLLHRLASPVIEAPKRGALHAIMIIHSFSSLDESFGDFSAFLKLYGIADVQTGQLYHLKSIGDLKLYAGWACGDRRFPVEPTAGEL